MTGYAITLFSLDSLTVTAYGSATSADSLYWAPDGTSGQYYSDYTFDLSSGTSVTITDNDGEFGDDDVSWGTWSPAPDGQPQELASDTSVGSTTYTAGSFIEDEWEITLVDQNGTEYRLVGVSINDQLVGYTFDGAFPPDGATLQFLNDGSSWDGQSMVPCFTEGTLIATPKGPVSVEQLKVGDLVSTADHGAQPLRWIGMRHINRSDLDAAPNMAPIRIRAGALGPDMPKRDIRFSPQHRVLVRSKIAERMLGEPEVLVAVKHLLAIPGIEQDDNTQGVTYLHLLLDRHEILTAENAQTESLHTGPIALKALGKAQRREVYTVFPELRVTKNTTGIVRHKVQGTYARTILSGKKARKLAERLVKNEKPAVDPALHPAKDWRRLEKA